MQVATQPSSFFLAGQHETFAGALQVVEKRAGVQRAAEVAGEVANERCSDSLSCRSGCAYQSSPTVLVRLQRNESRRGSPAPATRTPRGVAHADPLQVQFGAEFVRRRLEQPVDVGRRLELAGEPGQHLVGFAPSSIHDAVDEPVQPVAQRDQRECADTAASAGGHHDGLVRA